MKTTTFIDGSGKSQTTWLDSNTIRTCATESYNHIYKQAVKDIKSTNDDDFDEDPERKKKSQEQKEKEQKVDDIAKAEEHDKEKRIEAYRAEIKDLDDTELDELLESLRGQIEELKDQLKGLPDEEKLSKSANLETLGTESYHSVGVDGDAAAESLVALQSQRHRKKKLKHSQSYSVLTLDQNHNESKRGDELLMRLGSTDEPTKGNAKDDDLLKQLGSVD